MFKTILVLTLFFNISMFAQTLTINDVLKEIEQNNTRLLAIKETNKQQLLYLKANHAWQNPEIQAYYLPFGNHRGGDYREIQISQELDLPHVTIQKRRLERQNTKTLELKYQTERQKILLEAKQLFIEWVMIEKQMEICRERVKQLTNILNAIELAFKTKDVSILDVQKAKLLWIETSNRMGKLELKHQNVKIQLNLLNGNKSLDVVKDIQFTKIRNEDLDAIWQDKLKTDPEVLYLDHQEEFVDQQFKLEKAKRFPNITLGINQQETDRISYFGAMAGISIPLWKNSKRIKAKASEVVSQTLENDFVLQQKQANFSKAYQSYQSLVEKYDLYVESFSQIKSEELLLDAFEMGELSLSEYVLELQFYQNAFDNFLEIEKELWLAQAHLLKHRL
ncbi:MAG: TolC family protein [Flavobacteriales bacterium]